MLMLMRPLLALLLLLSCDPVGPDDGGTSDDGGPSVTPSLSIGNGEGMFRDFADGETLDIVSGCQGSQHIWIALQAQGLDPRGTIIDVSIRRASDDVVVSQTFRLRLSFQPVAGREGLFQVYGLTIVIPEPDEAVGQDLIVSATVTDRDGVEVTDERPIRADVSGAGCGG